MSSDTATGARHGHGMRSGSPEDPAAGPTGPTPWQVRLRRFGYVDRPRTPVGRRLVPPYRAPGTRPWTALGLSPRAADLLARRSSWYGPVLVALLAGLLRFWNLGGPHAVIFDETYYAKDAWSLLRYGYEGTWPKDANERILGTPPDIPLSPDASYVVHPPVGKWMIALGEGVFGLNPFGWRFAVALLGTLSVLMLCRIGRRLFRSTALGCLAGGLMAVDGLHFVMSRTALLDLVLMFWVLAAFGCLLVDRDRTRARLAAALPRDGAGAARPDAAVGDRLRTGARPWRIAAGVCLGLACATKWNGLYMLAAFGVLTLLWDAGARRTAGAERAYRSALRRDAAPAFLSLVPVAVAVYVASWAGWFAGDGGYYRNWAQEGGRGGSWTWLPDALRSLWHYQAEVYRFHVGLTDPHTYQSNPWSWPVLGRPVSYFYESPRPGEDGCPAATADKCAQEVLALGTPLLWWAACFALLYLVYRWGLRRDWRAGAVLCGVAAGWLPWFLYQERTIFLFYAVVFVPFLCLALAMTLGALLGPSAAREPDAAAAGGPEVAGGAGAPGSALPRARTGLPEPEAGETSLPKAGDSSSVPVAHGRWPGERRRMLGAVAAGALVLLIVWNFVYFWPIYTGQPIPLEEWRGRMWFDTWV